MIKQIGNSMLNQQKIKLHLKEQTQNEQIGKCIPKLPINKLEAKSPYSLSDGSFWDMASG